MTTRDEDKSKEQLITELTALRRRVAEFESSPDGSRQTKEPPGKAEEIFRLALNTPADFWALLDEERTILGFNETAARRLGKSVNEIIGLRLEELFSPEVAKFRWSHIRQVFETGRPHRFEDLRAGSWFDVVVTPVDRKDGKVTKVSLIARDITTRKETEASLLENQIRYQSLFEDSPTALWEGDYSAIKTYLESLNLEDGKDFKQYFDRHPDIVNHCLNLVQTVDVNRATLKLYQARNKEEVTTHLVELVASELLDVFKEQLVAIATGQTSLEAETEIMTLTGDKVYADMLWSVVRGHEQTYARVLVSLTDKTARREAEEAYRTLVDHAMQGLAILHENGIAFVNPAMSRILGYSVDEFLAMSLDDLFETATPGYRQFLNQRREKWLAGETLPASFEMQIIRKDGARRWVERFGTTIQYQGKRAQQISLVDITDHKQAQAALQRQNLELESLTEAMQVFTATLDIEQVLAKVVHGLHHLLGTMGCVIWLVDEQTGQLVCRQTNLPWLRTVIGYRFRPGQGIAGWVVRHGQSLIVPDAQEDDRYFTELEETHNVHIRSLLSIPLQSEGQVIGVIQAIDSQVDHFNEAHLRLVEPLAAAASIAIKNAELYQKAQQVDQLRVLDKLDEALTRAILNPETVAEVTIQHAAAALNSPTNAIWVLSPRPDTDPDRLFLLSGGWKKDESGRVRTLQYGTAGQLLPTEQCAQLLGNGFSHAPERKNSDGFILPVISEGEPVAVMLFCGRSAAHPLTEREQALARAIAGRAAQSFQSARLYQSSQARAAYLTTLHAISTTVVSSLELQTVLRQVLELVGQAMEATEGFILLLEQESGDLFFAMTLTEETRNLRGRRIEADRSIFGVVVRNGKAVRIGDVRRDPRFSKDIDALTGFKTRSLVCAPLTYRNQIIGALEIVHNHPDRFSSEDLDLLGAVASIATVALQNARLYTASRTRATELTILNEIGRALVSTLDYKTVVRLALSLTGGLFKAELSALFQPDPQTGKLRSQAVQASIEEGELVDSSLLHLPLEEKIAEWVLTRRRPTVVKDARNDLRLLNIGQEIGDENETWSVMATPLLVAGLPTGVLTVTRPEADAYSLEDVRTLQAIASILVMALDNARLYAEQVRLLQEQERAQTQLIRTEKIVALGRLAASIMHEINNPLQAIQNFLGLAQEELEDGQQPDQLARYLNVIGQEVDRVSTIVRNLRYLYSSAPEGFQIINLHVVLDSVLHLMARQFERAQIVIEQSWDPALPPVEANADQLRQVFLNLILNAIDAMPEGGVLRIGTSRTPPPGDQEAGQPLPDHARLDFSDTGQGLPEEIQSHLFEPFFTTKAEGSGLGLSISYSIIRAHSGQLTVTSHQGLGTTFTISLPLKQPRKERQE